METTKAVATAIADAIALESVPLAAGENHVGEVGGRLTTVSVELTRPSDTTPYGVNDVVSNSASATTPMEFANIARSTDALSGYIVKARLSTDKKSITPRIRVHLFNAANPTLAADNVNWKELYADADKRLGYFDLPAMTTAADASSSDMSRTFDLNLRIAVVAAANRSLYAVLETLDAFTPASGEKFRLTLVMDNN